LLFREIFGHGHVEAVALQFVRHCAGVLDRFGERLGVVGIGRVANDERDLRAGLRLGTSDRNTQHGGECADADRANDAQSHRQLLDQARCKATRAKAPRDGRNTRFGAEYFAARPLFNRNIQVNHGIAAPTAGLGRRARVRRQFRTSFGFAALEKIRMMSVAGAHNATGSNGGTTMKWIRLIFVALGGIIAVLIFFVVIGVPAQVVASSLSRQLEASTGLRLKNIGFAKLAILPELGLTLEDVSVEDAASGQPVFSTRRARAGIALESLLKGQIRITDIAISGSTVSVGNWKAGPAVRQAAAQPSQDAAARNENFTRMFAVEQLTADDCTLILDNGRERNELRLDSVRLTSTLSPSQDRLTAKLDARSGANAVQITATLASPTLLLEQKPVRIEATIEPSGPWQSRATITGNFQVTGPVIKMDEIQGTFDRGRVVGSVSLSLARAKPFVDVDLDVEKLDLTDVAPAARTPRAAATSQPAAGGRRAEAPRDGGWSNRAIGFSGLRLFEANARIGAREIVLD